MAKRGKNFTIINFKTIIEMTKEQVLQECTVEGNVVKLPNIQLDRKEYLEVKKVLELIGGKWKGGKVAGFVFATDPTDLLNQVANGEKRNLKKEFQFFATPEKLADELAVILIEEGAIASSEESFSSPSRSSWRTKSLHPKNPKKRKTAMK